MRLAQIHQRWFTRGVVALALGVVMAAVATTSLSAQTATPSATKPPVVTPTTGASTQQLDSLRTTYRTQLAAYRNDERAYTIAKEQYAQLQTLASLEEAVKATQKVMIARAALLETYFQMLKITLQNTPGIEVPMKNDHLEAIDFILDELHKHRLAVEKATDRTSVDAMQVEFTEIDDMVKQTAYRTLMMVSYGRAQTLYDKTLAVSRDFADQIDREEKNPLVLAEKRRGFAEIGRNLTDIKTDFAELTDTLNRDPKAFTESSYGNFVEDLQGIFSGLSRSITYLEEIIK
jgi:hypothetical protein